MDKNENNVLYLIFGHTTLDNIIYDNGSAYFRTPGGGGLNAASAASCWCNAKEIGLVTKFGNKLKTTDEDIIRHHVGINGEGITKMTGSGLKLWLLTDDNGYRHWVLHNDSCTREEAAPKPEDIPSKFLETAVGCHFAPLPITILNSLIDALPSGMYIQVDPHYEYFVLDHQSEWTSTLKRMDIIMPSQDELTKFFGIPYDQSELEVKRYAKRLSELGPGIVVVKVGEKGVIVYQREDDSCFALPSLAETIIDATGAGDSFCGGFLVNKCKGDSLQTASIKGLISSAMKIAKTGVIPNFLTEYGFADRKYIEIMSRGSAEPRYL